MPVALLLLFVLACAAPPSEPPPTASPPAAPPAPIDHAARTVRLAEGQFSYCGRTIDFPATIESLTELLGPPSRTSAGRRVTDTWDDLGIRASHKPDESLVNEITISVSQGWAEDSPTSPFLGKVRVPGGTLGLHATADDLRAVGFCSVGSADMFWQQRTGRYCLGAMRREALVDVFLAWRGPDPQHVTGPPLAEDQLFTADSRAYGFPMDMTLREVWHSGNLSMVRIEGTGRNVGPGLFLMGTLGEIARRRGYEYFVMPEHRGDAEFAVGFTHDEDANLQREFPDEPDLWGQCDVQPHDFVFDTFGTWPDGGRPRTQAEAEAPQPR